MVFAAFLLLCPLPQIADKAPVVPVQFAAVSSVSEKNSSLSRELPSTPQPKVKTDAEAASDPNSSANASKDSTTAPSAAPANSNVSVTTNSSLSSEAILPGTPAFQPAPLKLATSHPYEDPRDRRVWYALVITSHGAAALDAWSTRRALSNNDGTESNPLLRPFAHSSMMYAATQVTPLLMDYVGKRMMVSRHPLLRKTWWLPQSLGTAMSLSAGVHNVGVVR
jgi:hypothetical protein